MTRSQATGGERTVQDSRTAIQESTWSLWTNAGEGALLSGPASLGCKQISPPPAQLGMGYTSLFLSDKKTVVAVFLLGADAQKRHSEDELFETCNLLPSFAEDCPRWVENLTLHEMYSLQKEGRFLQEELGSHDLGENFVRVEDCS